MKIDINAYWGILGCLGVLGYVLEDPNYYIFFVFFLFFLQPVAKKAVSPKKGGNNRFKWLENLEWHTVSIWLGSLCLITASLALIILKTMELGVKILISGHTHWSFIKDVGGVLLLNPGSPTVPRLSDPSVMLLEIENQKIDSEIIKVGSPVCKALNFQGNLEKV